MEIQKHINVMSIQNVQRIIDYIEANMLEELTPQYIAEHFYLSVTGINNLFKTVCEMTVMEYLRNRRLSLAGKELLVSNLQIIELAFKYGYETPEAFTKAFTRFHGFPPSFVRRAYPEMRVFSPLVIKIEIQGGWEDALNDKGITTLTKQNDLRQENTSLDCYNKTNKLKGGVLMNDIKYHISLKEMEQKEDWGILLLVAQRLNEEKIKFKVDGKTMLFAHGIAFKLEKICLTFKWHEEERIKKFFGYTGSATSSFKGFKYFDVIFQGMQVRCMFYGECEGADTDEFLFRNTDQVEVDGQIIDVQTLEFYYENANPSDTYYERVEQYLKTYQK